MGATNIENWGVGPDMRTVFTSLVDDALHYYGHDPYNGTISTIDGYRDKTKLLNDMLNLKSRKTKKWIHTCVDQFREKAWDVCDKRECWAAEVYSPKSTKKKKQFIFVGWAAE